MEYVCLYINRKQTEKSHLDFRQCSKNCNIFLIFTICPPLKLYYGPILYFKGTRIVIGMSVATSTLWKVLHVDQRNYAAQFHATSSCIKFGKGAQSPRNLRAIGRVYCVMQGSAACSYSLIWFWWCAHADSISVFDRFWSPRVISAYYTLFSKSRRLLTRINAFLPLRRKKAWDRKKYHDDCWGQIKAKFSTLFNRIGNFWKCSRVFGIWYLKNWVNNFICSRKVVKFLADNWFEFLTKVTWYNRKLGRHRLFWVLRMPSERTTHLIPSGS